MPFRASLTAQYLRRLSLLLALGLAVFAVSGAGAKAADGFAAAVAELNAKGTKAKIRAIKGLAATGDARAVPVLQALLAGKLYLHRGLKRPVLTTKSAAGFDAFDPIEEKKLTGLKKSELKKIRVNNRLRKVIRAVLGGLTLFSKDPGQRLAAANAMFKARDPGALALLQQALKKEQDADVLARLQLARMATEATSPASAQIPAARRMAAIQGLAEYPNRQVQSLLTGLLADKELATELRDAANSALVAVNRELAFWGVVQSLFQGISLGSVLLLAAVGLAITFGVMGVINMAHGELVMLGAYTTYVIQDLLRAQAPELMPYSLIMAVPLAFLVSGLFGIAIEHGIIRHLYGRPLETLLATWGLSLILQQLVRSLFGPTNQEVSSPDWMSGAMEFSGGLVVTYNRLSIIIFSFLVLAAIGLILRRSYFGLQMRAVTQNRAMAASMGIRTGWVDAMTFGLGAGIAGVAGVALSQIDNVSPNLGQAYIIDSFLVVVFGGVGNLWGTLVGALSLGIFNKFLEPVAGAVLAKILILVLVIIFIQKRPRDLFAQKGRAAEA